MSTNLRQLLPALIAIIVFVLAALIVLVLFPQSGSDSGVPRLTKTAFFPAMRDIRARVDNVNPRYIWLESGPGAIRIDLDTRESIFWSELVSGLTYVTDTVQVGGRLFMAYQGGIAERNLSTGSLKHYTVADGLVSGSNLQIVPDPADADILWIGTFRGLSKLHTSTGRIESFTTELGIPGTSVQPRVFHVDDTYVWVTASANAYTTGGIARLDKAAGVWKAWGVEDFPDQGAYPRLDPVFGAAAHGDGAAVVEDGVIYSYDAAQDAWRAVRAGKESAPVVVVLGLEGRTLYFKQDTLKQIDLDTREEREVLAGAGFDEIRHLDLYTYDAVNKRFLVYAQSEVSDDTRAILAVVPREGTEPSEIILQSELRTVAPLANVSLHDAEKNHVILVDDNRLVEYDTATKGVRELLPFRVDRADVVGDYVVASNFAWCEMYCRPPFIATTTVVSLLTGEIIAAGTLLGTTTDRAHVGDTLEELYFLANDYDTTGRVFRFDTVHETFAEQFVQGLAVSTRFFNAKGEPVPFVTKSPDDSFEISYAHRQESGGVQLDVRDANGQTFVLQSGLGQAVYSPFSDTSKEVEVSGLAFDPNRNQIVWLGTDRGLVRFDLALRTSELFTSEDGLSRNRIDKVIVADQLIVEHTSGVAVYEY